VSGSPLPVARARELVLAEVMPMPAERVRLEDCLGRVTADEVKSAVALQPFDNSAMDGYALRSADTDADSPVRLRLVAEARAGHPAAASVGAGEAAWISTGAMVPDGADAVLPVEEASEDGDEVLPGRRVAPGEHVRRAGEDLRAGEVLLPVGRLLGAAELAILAATGNAEVECARRPTVAVLSSGDELVPPAEPLAPGQIHDSNGFALPAQAREAGAIASYSSWLPDDAAATRAAIAGALDCDVLVVAGGVSVGRHDHVKGALTDLGVEERFWRVAMRPGGPTWFGVLPRRNDRGRTLVFGLPGNPVSAMVTFHLFARAALRAMTGLPPDAGCTEALLAEPYRKKAGKAHYVRCRLELTEEGWRAHLTRSSQGSHVLTSMLGADGLATLPADREEFEAGERVAVELLR
jgi:molybdopterin molybdotransferase